MNATQDWVHDLCLIEFVNDTCGRKARSDFPNRA